MAKESQGKIHITVDSREHNSGMFRRLSSIDGVRAERAELPCGDYLLGEDLAVERKAANDFAISIMDRRLFQQVAALKAAYDHPVVIIEGDIFSIRSAITQEALIGALSYLSVIEKITVHHVGDAAQCAALLVTMARHRQQGLGYEVPLRANKPKDWRAISQYLVEGLPGIGPTASKKLLSHFGSAEAVFRADQESIQRVPGIGPKTALRIREALSASYPEQ